LVDRRWWRGVSAVGLNPIAKIHPLSARANPTATRLISPAGKRWSQVQPRGLDYWERLHAIVQIEPVEERDRMMMAMLAPLGIERASHSRRTNVRRGSSSRGPSAAS